MPLHITHLTMPLHITHLNMPHHITLRDIQRLLLHIILNDQTKMVHHLIKHPNNRLTIQLFLLKIMDNLLCQGGPVFVQERQILVLHYKIVSSIVNKDVQLAIPK